MNTNDVSHYGSWHHCEWHSCRFLAKAWFMVQTRCAYTLQQYLHIIYIFFFYPFLCMNITCASTYTHGAVVCWSAKLASVHNASLCGAKCQTGKYLQMENDLSILHYDHPVYVVWLHECYSYWLGPCITRSKWSTMHGTFKCTHFTQLGAALSQWNFHLFLKCGLFDYLFIRAHKKVPKEM